MNSNRTHPRGSDHHGLRHRRQDKGLSQEQLARLADCSTKMVALLEAGYQPSGSQVLARIEEALTALEASA
jgi:transcriptional regulator with XRE-family HTH domain